MNLEIEKNSSYLLSPIIVYKEKRKNIIQRSFSYEIIKEGVYLKALLSAYTSTSKGKQYKIPDRYDAINPNSKTAWPGTLVFGLQLESVNKAREAKNRELKSIEHCSNHTILRRAKKFGSQALELLKSKLLDNYSKKDHVNIKAIDYLVNNYNFHIEFGKEDLVKTKQNQLATVQALDKAKISREGYRNIAAVNPTISCKYAIFNERILLTKQMEANIKITQVNLEFLEVEIDSTEVENVDPKEITNMARI
ncbi:5878_t:CDS:2, partial [Dentiscutata heterogama]